MSGTNAAIQCVIHLLCLKPNPTALKENYSCLLIGVKAKESCKEFWFLIKSKLLLQCLEEGEFFATWHILTDDILKLCSTFDSCNHCIFDLSSPKNAGWSHRKVNSYPLFLAIFYLCLEHFLQLSFCFVFTIVFFLFTILVMLLWRFL